VTSGSQVIELHDVSPDGRWIVYNGNIRGNSDLYKMPLGGGEAVPLTDFPGDEFSPRWSPDGREITFDVGGWNGQIMVMPAGGGVPTVLTSSLRRVSIGPTWSPGGLAIAFTTNRTGVWRIWLVSRDSVGGAWHEAVPLTDFHCMLSDWAPNGSGMLCNAGGSQVLVSPQGRELWRRDLAATYGLKLSGSARYSRDGRTIYAPGDHRDGRRGVWAIPGAGGTPRLVVAFDDPALANPFGLLSVGPDRLYLTVAQYESDIWAMNLRY
jgi:Tol biopolymer transport system component